MVIWRTDLEANIWKIICRECSKYSHPFVRGVNLFFNSLFLVPVSTSLLVSPWPLFYRRQTVFSALLLRSIAVVLWYGVRTVDDDAVVFLLLSLSSLAVGAAAAFLWRTRGQVLCPHVRGRRLPKSKAPTNGSAIPSACSIHATSYARNGCCYPTRERCQHALGGAGARRGY